MITALNGETVKDSNALRNEVSQMMPGTKTKLTLLRDGKEETVTVKLAELKQQAAADNEGGQQGTEFQRVRHERDAADA